MSPIVRLYQPLVVAVFVAFATCLLASRVQAQAIQNLSVATPDGINLAATYFALQKPGPGVLLLSMCDPAADQSEWRKVAIKLQEAGIHVLTLDYRGFGTSEGQRPRMLGSVEEAMVFWRENWREDVVAAYNTLLAQTGVDAETMAIGGASCGVFMGLDLAFTRPHIKAFVSLGGPSDAMQYEQLQAESDLPLLIISGNEGPALEWSDDLFAASNHLDTRLTKYKIVTHGTYIFQHVPSIEDEIVAWFKHYLDT